ncbi:MAG TPA: DNA cytosine methyltransferase, partial [Nostocaceae cyanobacterium]|nr:DNA cytosine methyltransferase [Nostocaceae cyanobacterium]
VLLKVYKTCCVKMLNAITVCSGIGAPEVAGFNVIAQSEIDSHANSVLRHHYPNVQNLGDMVTANWHEWDADLLVGGTPCVSFSMLGDRQSLSDERGNLALKFVDVFEQVKAGIFVYENVSSILTTSDNAFGCLLSRMVGAKEPLYRSRWNSAGFLVGDTGSVAWRVLDAKYFTLPQRRSRVFVVGFNFRNGKRLFSKKPRQDCRGLAGIPAAIMFEPSSEKWNIKESQYVKSQASRDDEISSISAPIICFTSKDNGRDWGINIAPTLRAGAFNKSRVNGGVKPAIIYREGDELITRYLSPVECLRLQGFPNNYLDILHNNNPLVDGAKYRLIGNSMAVPVMSWIRLRIEKVVAEVNFNLY